VEDAMKILVPVDGSAHSLKALEIAADFAKTRQAEIYVISVAASIGSMEDHEISPSRRERHEEILREHAEAAIKVARELLEARQVDVKFSQTVSTSVSVPDAIIDFAEDEQIDLIVIGSRGLSVSSRFKIGSIANQVVRYCPCSVYLVKMPAAARA
jgi:nucleotide-binding universal stress UspA family protein